MSAARRRHWLPRHLPRHWRHPGLLTGGTLLAVLTVIALRGAADRAPDQAGQHVAAELVGTRRDQPVTAVPACWPGRSGVPAVGRDQRRRLRRAITVSTASNVPPVSSPGWRQ